MKAPFATWCMWIVLSAAIAGTANQDSPTSVRTTVSPLTDEERKSFVNAHNDARRAVAVGTVEWSDELAAFAEKWLVAQTAAMKAQAAEGKFPNPGHRPREGEHRQRYGENISIWGGTPDRVAVVPAGAVARWLKEKAAFDELQQAKPYVVGDEQGKTTADGQPLIVGHYTQVVWKETKRIGAGRVIVDVVDDSGRVHDRFVVVVCNYDPAGNRLGEKPY